MRGEVKGAARTELALGPDSAAHQLDQPRRDRQAEPRAAILARHGPVDLLERAKDSLQLVRGNADPGVPHAEVEQPVAGSAPAGLDRLDAASVSRHTSTATSPRAVNLSALPTTFTSTCRKRPESPTTRSGTSGAMPYASSRFLLAARTPSVRIVSPTTCRRLNSMGLRSNRPASTFEKSRMSLIGLERRVGGRLHHVEVLALLRSQRGAQRQLGHADDAIHRRPNLMAHVGQELALRAAGGFGDVFGGLRCRLGPLQLSLGELARRDVAQEPPGPDRAPVFESAAGCSLHHQALALAGEQGRLDRPDMLSVHQPIEHLPALLAALRSQDVREPELPDRLVAVAEGLPPGAVGVRDRAVRRQALYEVARVLDHVLVAAHVDVAPLQLDAEAFERIGNVARHAEQNPDDDTDVRDHAVQVAVDDVHRHQDRNHPRRRRRHLRPKAPRQHHRRSEQQRDHRRRLGGHLPPHKRLAGADTGREGHGEHHEPEQLAARQRPAQDDQNGGDQQQLDDPDRRQVESERRPVAEVPQAEQNVGRSEDHKRGTATLYHQSLGYFQQLPCGSSRFGVNIAAQNGRKAPVFPQIAFCPRTVGQIAHLHPSTPHARAHRACVIAWRREASARIAGKLTLSRTTSDA